MAPTSMSSIPTARSQIRPVKVAQISDGQALIDSGLKANETGRRRRAIQAAARHPCHDPARQGGAGSRSAQSAQQAPIP